MNKQMRSYFILFGSIVIGILTGFSHQKIFFDSAQFLSSLFINFLSMIAGPIVFLSILSTLIGMKGLEQIKTLGRKVLTYTLLTTVLASLVALGCFLLLDPVASIQKSTGNALEIGGQSYAQFLLDIVPTNIFKAFLENKIISIAFLGALFGITAHFLNKEEKETLHRGISALFQLFLKVVGIVNYVMPIAIWAFTVLLIKDVQSQSSSVSGLWNYLLAIVLANLIQGIVIIPLLLKMRGLSPWRIAKGAFPALLTAFFTKSSNAALPISLRVAQEKLGVRPHIANFSLPLCTVINMNGCAAFILTTVLFVAGVHGHLFTPFDLAFWVLMSVLAAIGNAGVPMGCFFLSSAFLISMNVPLSTMGLILPFYALIDMEETALNVWSDISVTSIVDRDLRESAVVEA